MGSMFSGGLTKTGLGSDPQHVKYFNSPSGALAAGNDQLAGINYGNAGITYGGSDPSSSGVPPWGAPDQSGSSGAPGNSLPWDQSGSSSSGTGSTTPFPATSNRPGVVKVDPLPASQIPDFLRATGGAPSGSQASAATLPFLKQYQGGPDAPAPDIPLPQPKLTLNSSPNAGSVQKIIAPSFLQAATSGPAGTPNAMSPALTKGGSLLTMLFSGLEGAAAGAGDRKFNEGFSHGNQLPFLQAYQRQELQHSGLENELTQAQIKNLPLTTKLHQAQIDWYEGRTGRAGTHEVPGVGLVSIDNDGNSKVLVPEGAKTINPQNATELAIAIANAQDPGTRQRLQTAFDAVQKTPADKQTTAASLADEATSSPDPVRRQQAAKALKMYGYATRPPAQNLAGQNQDRKDDKQAQAENIAAGILDSAGGDPDKALALFDRTLPNVTDQTEKNLSPYIRNAIRARRAVNKPDPVKSALDAAGITAPTQ